MNSFFKFFHGASVFYILCLLTCYICAYSQAAMGAVANVATASVGSESLVMLTTSGVSKQLSENIPVIRGGDKLGVSETTIVWLVTLFALILAFAYIIVKFKSGAFDLRRRFLRLEKKHINLELKLKKQLMLTPKISIHLISWNGDELLIGCSDNQISLLDKKKLAAPTSLDAGKESANESELTEYDRT